MLCVLTRLTNDLMIVGEENKAIAHQGYPVDCADIEKIAPVFAAVQTIANASNYNGFGVANIKLTPRHLTNNEIYHRLAEISMIDVNSDNVVATRQSLSDRAEENRSGENIRFFEVSCISVLCQLCSIFPRSLFCYVEQVLMLMEVQLNIQQVLETCLRCVYEQPAYICF